MPSERRRMVAALVYLQATSIAGALRQRLKRLKQPKYLLGALAFLAYLGFMIGPRAWQANHGPGLHAFPPAMAAILGSALPLFVLLWMAVSWLWPADRAVLRFSEAEIAFLFPAPLSRAGLINFSLLRAQLAIFVSAFLLSLLFGRGRGLPGNPLQHATALWILFATLRLHALGASFTHARFSERGGRAWLRRSLASVAVLLVLLGMAGWVALSSPPPPALAGDGPRAIALLLPWLSHLLNAPPLSWLLAPFALVSAPMAGSGGAWWRALVPALAVLVLHYLWVLRANVSFEEASIEQAQQRAERALAKSEGRWSGGARKPRPAPFPLATHGPVAIAFLWQGLIGAGPFWRPRNLALAVLGMVVAVVVVAATPYRPLLGIGAGVALVSSAMSGFFAPMMAQRRLRETLDLLDIFKAGPLAGSQIALGQLLTPAALAAISQWIGLLLVALCVVAADYREFGTGALLWSGLASAALLGPLLSMVMICIPFAWVLWFPAWAESLGARGGGFEAAGQRMIFGVAYLVLAAVAMAPAALLGALAWWMLGSLLGAAAALFVGALFAAGVLVAELTLLVRTLGWKIDRFDLSTEMR
jgi:hypothetical protein